MARRVAVVGGGITGLCAAFYLQRRAAAAGVDLDLTVIERDDRFGGKIQTERAGALVLEGGPDSYLARKPWAGRLCADLGLSGDIVGMAPGLHASVLHRGRLHPLPEGIMLGIPSRVGPFVSSGLISPLGKLRAGIDLLLPRGGGAGDESLGGFLARRLGREVLERLAEPLLAGIYSGDADQLSLLATFPMLRDLETKHRSLILGVLAQRQAAPPRPAGKAPEPMFATLRGGLERITDALVAALAGAGLRRGAAVDALAAAPEGYRLGLSSGEELQAEAVLLTTPAYDAAALLAALAPAAAGELQAIPYVSVATVALAYPMAALRRPLQGTGFVVPRSEGLSITAATWVSNKWPLNSDADHALIRCYVGRAGQEEMPFCPDGEIIDAVRRDLSRIIGLEAAPELTRIVRWSRAMPQYRVGHLDALARLDAALARLPGVYLAGAAYRGLGIPDCIQQGQAAADRVLQQLTAGSAPA